MLRRTTLLKIDAAQANRHKWIVLYRAAPACRGSKRRLLATGFAAALFCAPVADARTTFEAWRGSSAPRFSLQTTAGSDLALESLRGRPVIVQFFATWCEPCREEFPALDRFVARAQGAIRIVAISVAEPDLRVRRFLETTRVTFPVVLDRDRAVAKAWGVSQLPSTIVLNGDLKPVVTAPADFAWDKVEPQQLTDRLQSARASQPSKNNQGRTK